LTHNRIVFKLIFENEETEEELWIEEKELYVEHNDSVVWKIPSRFTEEGIFVSVKVVQG